MQNFIFQKDVFRIMYPMICEGFNFSSFSFFYLRCSDFNINGNVPNAIEINCFFRGKYYFLLLNYFSFLPFLFLSTAICFSVSLFATKFVFTDSSFSIKSISQEIYFILDCSDKFEIQYLCYFLNSTVA